MCGVDTSGTDGSGAIVQNPTATTGSGTTASITLATFGSSNNYAVSVMSIDSNKNITPGTDFTEIHEVLQSENASAIQTQYKANETAVSATWTGTQAWAMIGIEVKADASAVDGGDFFDFF